MIKGTRSASGFTLAELAVALAIVIVLLAIMLPAIAKAREAANCHKCQDNLRQIGVALHAYHHFEGALPPALRVVKDPFPFMSWQARILPWIDEGVLWTQTQQAFTQDLHFWTPPHHVARTTIVSLYICPTDGRTLAETQPTGTQADDTWAAYTHYLGVSGAMPCTGVLFYDSHIRLTDITDGTSKTLLVGERPPSSDQRFGWWYAGIGQNYDGSLDSYLSVWQANYTYKAPTCPPGPYTYGPGEPNNLCDMFHFWSQHRGGANFLFADGSVHFLPYSAAPIMAALATRAGREVIPATEW
jgi:prepilin-type processing-associated H-X9-DG protein